MEPFEPKEILYYSRDRKDEIAAIYTGLELHAATSDIIFIAVPESAGQLFDKELLQNIKDDALIVSVSSTNIFDLDTLLERLQQHTIRVAIDHLAPSDAFLSLPMHTWFNTNAHTAYNTYQANKAASDAAVTSILNLLTTGEDSQRVV